MLSPRGWAGAGGAVCRDWVHPPFLWETVFALPCMPARAGEALCIGVETCRFEFAVEFGATVDAGVGRGGLGGGIFSMDKPDLSKTTLCGLGGIVGLDSPVTSGVI